MSGVQTRSAPPLEPLSAAQASPGGEPERPRMARSRAGGADGAAGRHKPLCERPSAALGAAAATDRPGDFGLFGAQAGAEVFVAGGRSVADRPAAGAALACADNVFKYQGSPG